MLIVAIVKEVRYTPSEKNVRDGKNITIMKLYGSWEQSYNDLPLFLIALQAYNPGTRVDWSKRMILKYLFMRYRFNVYYPYMVF